MHTPQILTLLRRFASINTQRAGFLWMWHTSGSIADAHWLMECLGYLIITDWVWVKKRVGTGQYRRGQHETLILGKRMGLDRVGQWPSSVFTEEETEHSRKPEESYRCIETVTPGPRLEIFARRQRPGWTVWGNEVTDDGAVLR